MADPKRASMREGPLAALFRKTEDGAGRGRGAQAAPDVAPEAAPRAPLRRARRAQRRARAPRAARAPARRAGAARTRALRAACRTPRCAARCEAEAPRVPAPAGAPAPRLLLGDPREHDGAAARASRARRRRRALRDEPRARSARRCPSGQPVIRVVGVGGAGVNAVNRMVEAEVEGVEFLAVNTDLQSLQQSTADITLHIGAEVTRGLGSGSDANVGRQAAMDDYDRIKALLKGSDMIFITAGAGGGTGTGAAPIVARIAREVGALTVAIVTKPFGFEGIAPQRGRPSAAWRRSPRRSTR